MPLSKDWLRRLNEAAEKARIMEEGQMKAPTQEQMNDPEWWDENAPEDATHYCPVAKLFYDDSYPIAPCCIPRPTKPAAPEWDGEGLPPVGSEIEVWFNSAGAGYWQKGMVIAHDNNRVVVRAGNEYYGRKNPGQMRPLPSQEVLDRKALTETIKGAVRLGLNERGIANMVWADGWRKEQ